MPFFTPDAFSEHLLPARYCTISAGIHTDPLLLREALQGGTVILIVQMGTLGLRTLSSSPPKQDTKDRDKNHV